MRVLIQRYIRDGQPVGSRTLSRDSGLDLSPATIRNVMSDLEDLGLVSAPHTSAGRVPTPQGYRMFVDTLVRYRQPDSNEVRRIREKLKTDYDSPGQLVTTVSSMLDRFLWGRVDRISPEAPVPVVRLESETTKLGGAANVAANICALGAEALRPRIQELSRVADTLVSLHPNAGLPNELGGYDDIPHLLVPVVTAQPLIVAAGLASFGSFWSLWSWKGWTGLGIFGAFIAFAVIVHFVRKKPA